LDDTQGSILPALAETRQRASEEAVFRKIGE
jgi:hypothetical protein